MNSFAAIESSSLVVAMSTNTGLMIGGILVASLLALIMIVILIKYGSLWIQAIMSGADVSLASLVGMSLRNVKPTTIVKAQVMAKQAGITIAKGRGKTTASLESHYLAGGDVNRVIVAIIAAHRAHIDLDFDRATAIDLAGRNLQEAVQTSIFPKVIDCPDPAVAGKKTLSAIAKNGVELLVHVRVTVRTNLDQLIGGATEATIIARVGQGIVSTIGSMESHMEALEQPDRISRRVHEQGIQSNTAYEIVSIDMANIDVGENIGARLQSDQAEADTRIARAKAEIRRADAVAHEQEMRARVTENRSHLILADAEVPAALAMAIRKGQFHSAYKYANRKLASNDPPNVVDVPKLKPPNE